MVKFFEEEWIIMKNFERKLEEYCRYLLVQKMEAMFVQMQTFEFRKLFFYYCLRFQKYYLCGFFSSFYFEYYGVFC